MELARRASLERSGSQACGPEPRSFQVRDLMVEVELNPMLRSPGNYDDSDVERAWTTLIGNIRSYMADSKSVIVRGGNPVFRTRFSKVSLGLQFGTLGERCHWVDGKLFAMNRESEEGLPFHRTTTLNTFIDWVDDTSTCGNFLDGKDLDPSAPAWMKPLLDSTAAWNQTMHLRFTPKATKGKKSSPAVTIEEHEPSIIRSPTWTSQGWKLVTHPGFVTFPHHDCCGMGTYVIGTSGAKVWSVIRPKRDSCPQDIEGLSAAFQTAARMSPQGMFSGADVATVVLEAGDIM
jgi:hypothetical protein